MEIVISSQLLGQLPATCGSPAPSTPCSLRDKHKSTHTPDSTPCTSRLYAILHSFVHTWGAYKHQVLSTLKVVPCLVPNIVNQRRVVLQSKDMTKLFIRLPSTRRRRESLGNEKIGLFTRTKTDPYKNGPVQKRTRTIFHRHHFKYLHQSTNTQHLQ